MEMRFLQKERSTLKQQEINYRFSAQARADYFSILDYIASTLVNPDAADKFSANLFKSIKIIQTFPGAHPVEVKIKYEFRKMVVGSYLVFYVVLKKEIVIARILNSRQNFKKILKRSGSLS